MKEKDLDDPERRVCVGKMDFLAEMPTSHTPKYSRGDDHCLIGWKHINYGDL